MIVEPSPELITEVQAWKAPLDRRCLLEQYVEELTWTPTAPMHVVKSPTFGPDAPERRPGIYVEELWGDSQLRKLVEPSKLKPCSISMGSKVVIGTPRVRPSMLDSVIYDEMLELAAPAPAPSIFKTEYNAEFYDPPEEPKRRTSLGEGFLSAGKLSNHARVEIPVEQTQDLGGVPVRRR